MYYFLYPDIKIALCISKAALSCKRRGKFCLLFPREFSVYNMNTDCETTLRNASCASQREQYAATTAFFRA